MDYSNDPRLLSAPGINRPRSRANRQTSSSLDIVDGHHGVLTSPDDDDDDGDDHRPGSGVEVCSKNCSLFFRLSVPAR